MVTDSETAAPPVLAVDRRVPWRAIVIVVGVLVVTAAGLGAIGGWLWYHWWAPANIGEIYDTTEGPRWYDVSEEGLTHQFDGPALYAVVAIGLGSLLGALAALLGRHQALAALGGLVMGSALAAYLSWAVGTAMSPPDPQQFETTANIGKEYPAAIELTGWTPLLCWPLAALAAFCVTIVLVSLVTEIRRTQAAQQVAGNWLERQPSERPEITVDRSGQ